MSDPSSRRVDGEALGKAMGLLWAGAVAVLGMRARRGWGEDWQALLSDVSPGSDSATTGGVIGAVWAFADGFVGAYLLAWLYNLFQSSAK